MDDFAVFILTHGRPDNVKTINALENAGYTGKIYFIVDDEDDTIGRYIENFGADNVKVFDKKAYADSIDETNNFDDRDVIVHARNASFDIAEEIGITYFMQLDDDYSSFRYRWADNAYNCKATSKLDNHIKTYLDFYKSVDCKSIAFSQGGDFIGGEGSGMLSNYLYQSRKCMNSFICSTKRRFQFAGDPNEDVNTYVMLGSRGDLFLTLPFIGLEQASTQSQSGGVTEMYSRYGTYVKSFTTVMLQPSSVKVAMMGVTENRLHHRVKWGNTTPMIIDERYRKN